MIKCDLMDEYKMLSSRTENFLQFSSYVSVSSKVICKLNLTMDTFPSLPYPFLYFFLTPQCWPPGHIPKLCIFHYHLRHPFLLHHSFQKPVLLCSNPYRFHTFCKFGNLWKVKGIYKHKSTHTHIQIGLY